MTRQQERDAVTTWYKATSALTRHGLYDVDISTFHGNWSPSAFKKLLSRNTDLISRLAGVPVTYDRSSYAPSGNEPFGHGGQHGKHSQYRTPTLTFSGEKPPFKFTSEEAFQAVEDYWKKYPEGSGVDEVLTSSVKEKTMDNTAVARELCRLAKSILAMGAHHYFDGTDYYVDSDFLNKVQHVYPGAVLEHLGMGEFVLKTPDGELEFDRMRGVDFPGQSGRSHKLYDNAHGKVVQKAIALMERGGNSELVKTAAKKPSTPDEHAKAIAIKTLKMPDAMVGVMGGPSKAEARKTLKELGYTDAQIAKLEK